MPVSRPPAGNSAYPPAYSPTGRTSGAAFDPDTLFESGDIGDFFDLRSLDGMWKDASKTIPVTTSGDVIERIEGRRTTGTPTDLTPRGFGDMIWKGDHVSGDGTINQVAIRWFDGVASPFHEYTNGFSAFASWSNNSGTGDPIDPFMANLSTGLTGVANTGSYVEHSNSSNFEMADGGEVSTMAFADDDSINTAALIYDGSSGTADYYIDGSFVGTVTKGSETYWRAFYICIENATHKARTAFFKRAAITAGDVANLHTWGGGS